MFCFNAILSLQFLHAIDQRSGVSNAALPREGSWRKNFKLVLVSLVDLKKRRKKVFTLADETCDPGSTAVKSGVATPVEA